MDVQRGDVFWRAAALPKNNQTSSADEDAELLKRALRQMDNFAQPSVRRPLCPKARQWCDLTTGEMIPSPCASLQCEVCRSSVLPERRAAAVAATDPQTFVVITETAPRELSDRDAYKATQDEAQRLTAVVDGLAWAWNVERGERGGMVHLQATAASWGPAFDAAMAEAVRGRLVLTSDIRNAGAASNYLVKGMRRNPAQHLALNGGRITHSSRGYFGGPVREAERAAMRQRHRA